MTAPAASPPAAEDAARAARDSVLVVPGDGRAAILVSGKDARSWLNGLVTCNLATLGAGDAAYGLLVEKKGRIQTDLFVVPARDGSALALAVPTGLSADLLASLDHYLIMEDAELAAGDLAFVFAHGPKAAALAEAVPPELAPFAGKVDLLGGGGGVFGVPAATREAFLARLGELASGLGGIVTDDATWDAVRIEHGLPRFGAEVDATFYPQEAALEKLAVAFDKGCYLGQEVVYMLQERGHVKRKLVSLDLGDAHVPAAGTVVTTPEGEAVGDVRSAVLGPTSGKGTAIAMVKWAFTKAGTALAVAGAPATVR
ncbi:MAG: Folate-dependent protein for Fe/S cluster synthesis/repair in oxidative stress [Labilithrix sp.]|nr:Folate-dependent protein for Fe/S cluster synthesis/repair in oxidative stress [Labilithrix sp.]